MADPRISNIGAYVAVREGLAPLPNAAGTRNGNGIDRTALGANSAVVVAHVGAATGSPTSFTYDLKLQHSNDDGAADAYADYSPPGGASGAIAQATAAGLVELDVDLAGAKKYVRVVETVAITGGTTPKVPASAALVFGGGSSLPM